jgi:hypothetical protein
MSPHLKHFRILLVLLTALFCALAIPANAQAVKNPHQVMLPVFDAAHEITLQGTIKEAVSRPPAGSLMGLHLTVATARGLQDVHLGSFLSKDVTQNLLLANQPVQIVGSMTEMGGKKVLLARQLITSGRLIVVRNEQGFLVRPKPDAPSQHRPAVEKNAVAGGLQ